MVRMRDGKAVEFTTANRGHTGAQMNRRPMPVAALCAGLLAIAGTVAGPARAAAPPAVWPEAEFCGRAQNYIAGTGLRSTSQVHDGAASFARAAAAVQPLTVHQYTTYDGPGRSGARTISCKLIAAAAIRTAHGEGSAGREATCGQVNRNTLEAVRGALSPAELARATFDKARKVVIDVDATVAGADAAFEPYEFASVDRRGALRIVARAWTDAPPGARGKAAESATTRHHCQFIAPDYLRRLLTDPTIVLPGPAPKR
jgi:hypothetical protein